MGMDPKQKRVLEQQEDVVPEDEPRDVSDEARPRAGRTDQDEPGYGGGQASGQTGGSAVSEEDETNAPPVGKGNLGRRPVGPDVQPKQPTREKPID
jgi:hypothetical protein